MTEEQKRCDHPEGEHRVKFVQTEVDLRPMPRFVCKKCGTIGNVIYKVNPLTGNAHVA